jgi:hypothetical protein
MSPPDIRRLSEEGGSDLELALLRSARDDGPAPHARRRTLIALGLGGTLMATSTTTAAASTTGLALLKWLGVAAVGSALVAGGYQAGTTSNEQAAAPAPTVVRGAAQKTAHAAQIVGVKIVQDKAEQAEPEPIAQVEPPAAPPEEVAPPPEKKKKTAAAPAKPAADGLVEEIAALDRANQALKDDPDKALAQLDKHKKKFGSGTLGPEADVLRIEALAAKNDPRAVTLAREFLSKHPQSPMASRVRTILQQQQQNKSSE